MCVLRSHPPQPISSLFTELELGTYHLVSMGVCMCIWGLCLGKGMPVYTLRCGDMSNMSFRRISSPGQRPHTFTHMHLQSLWVPGLRLTMGLCAQS